MISVRYISGQYQSKHNSTGTRFVLVNNKVYKTDDPKRYIATIRRSSPGQIFTNLCECNEKGVPLQSSIVWK